VNDVQIDFVGRGIDLNDEIRAYAEDKLAGTVRFLEEPVEIRVVLEAPCSARPSGREWVGP
jgi:ribosome-associated translation inhibitor RaiA